MTLTLTCRSLRRRRCRTSLGRTAYRVVQEALTNVHKHARGAATRCRSTASRATGLRRRGRQRAAGGGGERCCPGGRRAGRAARAGRPGRRDAGGRADRRTAAGGSRPGCPWPDAVTPALAASACRPGAARRRRGAGPGRAAHDPRVAPTTSRSSARPTTAPRRWRPCGAPARRRADGHPDAAGRRARRDRAGAGPARPAARRGADDVRPRRLRVPGAGGRGRAGSCSRTRRRAS